MGHVPFEVAEDTAEADVVPEEGHDVGIDEAEGGPELDKSHLVEGVRTGVGLSFRSSFGTCPHLGGGARNGVYPPISDCTLLTNHLPGEMNRIIHHNFK